MEQSSISEQDPLHPTDFDQLVFLPDDLELFEIPDLKERAATIRLRLFPRLELLRTEALDFIKDVYEIDAMANSSYVNSPDPRKDAKKPEPFDGATLGIIGKGKNTALLNVKRHSGGAYNLNPTELVIRFSEGSGIQAQFIPFRYPDVSDDYVLAFRKLFTEAADDVEALFALGNLSHPFAGELKPLRDLFSIRRHDMRMQRIWSPNYWVPVFPDSLEDLLLSFVALFPFYEYGRAIAEGGEPQFSALVAKLRDWLQRPVDEEA